MFSFSLVSLPSSVLDRLRDRGAMESGNTTRPETIWGIVVLAISVLAAVFASLG